MNQPTAPTESPSSAQRNGHLRPSVPIPVPYGAHVVKDGVQFTLFSRSATRVWLMIFDQADAAAPIEEFELTPRQNRIGDVWHIHLRRVKAGQFYLYRLEGQAPKGHKNYFDPDQWVLDPYALAVSRPGGWGDNAGLEPGFHVKSGPAFPKGIIVNDEFDWTGDHMPNIPLSETVIYEAHLRGYTAHASSRVSMPGTFRGFRDKIPYLVKLGVTAVELLPIQEFNELEYYQENIKRTHLRNFWGYSTLAFFAPNGRYADNAPGQQVREFKKLVMALHRAGIEVIMDVVFNHTAEGGDGGPTYSFRGIDNSIYYMMDEKGKHYVNYSGCGNTVNSNHPIVRDFILDCLRYWVLHMHVDGFRFDLASVLTRGRNGELLPNPPIVEHIAEDPALRHTKIIAEAWDAAGTYQVGSFPSERWSEWNGRFRDDVRRFWSGERGTMGAFATRICGSSDLYNKNGQTPLKSINFVTSHDGFTLNDLVSYAVKHNEANNEGNRDGDNQNFSANHGAEGVTNDHAINTIRYRQQKNLLATLFLAQGVPMLLAGDEFSRSQGGNNNAYCQDNETSWVDWSLALKHNNLLEFTRFLIAFRRQHPTLRRHLFFTGNSQGSGGKADIRWFGPHGNDPDWNGGLSLACFIDGHASLSGATHDAPSLFLIFNADQNTEKFNLPDHPGKPWHLEFVTQDEKLTWEKGHRSVQVLGRTVAVFSSEVL